MLSAIANKTNSDASWFWLTYCWRWQRLCKVCLKWSSNSWNQRCIDVKPSLFSLFGFDTNLLWQLQNLLWMTFSTVFFYQFAFWRGTSQSERGGSHHFTTCFYWSIQFVIMDFLSTCFGFKRKDCNITDTAHLCVGPWCQSSDNDSL